MISLLIRAGSEERIAIRAGSVSDGKGRKSSPSLTHPALKEKATVAHASGSERESSPSLTLPALKSQPSLTNPGEKAVRRSRFRLISAFIIDLNFGAVYSHHIFVTISQ